jgi:site-specific DNA recombinase
MGNNKTKQGVIYGRKSRENAITLESQINACIEWAERNNIEYELFIEEGTQSSEDWNRPKLQEMLKKIENLEYDFVIVSEQTRISRTEDFSIFKKLMRETGTIFVTADTNESINYLNANDAVKSGIQQVFGEYELSTAKTRLKRGTVQSAKKGNWVAKKAPVGYKYDHETKRLKKTDDAEVIKMMFDLYINGLSTVEITHKFNVENVIAYHKKKGEMIPVNWSKSTVSRMLNNIAYVGHTLYGKTKVQKIKGKRQQIEVEEDQQILIENTHEAIITQETWNKVKEIMKEKRTLPPSIKHAKHTYSGLVVCANCGSTHTFEIGSYNKKKRISSCKTRVYNKDFSKYEMCGNSGNEVDAINLLFEASLVKRLDEIKQYKEVIIASGDKTKSLESQISARKERIKVIQKKSKKIQSLIEEDFYDAEEEAEKIAEVKDLKNRIKELEKEITELKEKESESELDYVTRVEKQIENFFIAFKDLTMNEKTLNEILSKFIGKIIYRKKSRWDELKLQVILKQEIEEILAEYEFNKIA